LLFQKHASFEGRRIRIICIASFLAEHERHWIAALSVATELLRRKRIIFSLSGLPVYSTAKPLISSGLQPLNQITPWQHTQHCLGRTRTGDDRSGTGVGRCRKPAAAAPAAWGRGATSALLNLRRSHLTSRSWACSCRRC
jgi:hypothetical protein